MSVIGQFPDPFPELADDEVHVWKCSLQSDEGDVASRIAILSADERKRANQFKVERPRNQFIVTRSTLRFLIGKYLQSRPEQLEFEIAEHGKPHLRDSSGRLEFNVSHSHDLALFAFARFSPIGIDVEWLGRKVSHADVAKRFFSELEQEQLNQLPEEDRQRAFLECWTRKEAYLKARGFGLSRDPRTFSVPLSSDLNTRLLEDQADASAVQGWRIYPLQPEHHYCGATVVSVDSPDMKVICQWQGNRGLLAHL